jgi:fumarylacetoacetase
MRPGDLLGTGTISGETRDEFGSLMEISWNGSNPFLIHGEERTFL